jgi:hypothetical protein
MPAGRPKGQAKTGGRKPGTPNKATSELQGLARQYTEHAIKVLAMIMVKGESEQARIAAARELLDRGHGKATQILAGDPAAGPVRVAFRWDDSPSA